MRFVREHRRLSRILGVAVLACAAAASGQEAGSPRESGVVAAGAEANKGDDKIVARAFLSVDRLPAGGSCRVVMVVEIEEGWNIKTNPAQPKTFIPTVFSIKSKHGTMLRDVRYPEGKKITDDEVGEQSVYEDKVLLYGVLDVPKQAAGQTEEIEMAVRYQACKGKVCLIPKTVRLTGKLAVAPPGEAVRQINSKYFAAAAQK